MLRPCAALGVHVMHKRSQAQTDSKLKLIAQSLQRQVDELKLENGVMRAAMKEQAKKVDSISGRQNELLKRGATKQPITPTPQSEASSVSNSNLNSVTACLSICLSVSLSLSLSHRFVC